jgi:hypothetical protein
MGPKEDPVVHGLSSASLEVNESDAQADSGARLMAKRCLTLSWDGGLSGQGLARL